MVSPITHHRIHIHIHTTTTLFTVATIVVTAIIHIHIHIRIHPTILSSPGAITPSTAISNGEAYQPY